MATDTVRPSAAQVAHLDALQAPVPADAGSYVWKPVRHHFGVTSFGVNAQVAPHAGDWVVEEHTETGNSGTLHEELYLVVRGRATFQVAGDTIDAPAGTFVYVRDPAATRSARAVDDDTAILAIGGEPGAAFKVSAWERRHFGDA